MPTLVLDLTSDHSDRDNDTQSTCDSDSSVSQPSSGDSVNAGTNSQQVTHTAGKQQEIEDQVQALTLHSQEMQMRLDELEKENLILTVAKHELQEQLRDSEAEKKTVLYRCDKLQSLVNRAEGAKCSCKARGAASKPPTEPLPVRQAPPTPQPNSNDAPRASTNHKRQIIQHQDASQSSNGTREMTCPQNNQRRVSAKVTPMKPKTRVTILASSMGRGLSTELNRRGHLNCYGSVNPSAGAEHLAHKAHDVVYMNKPDVLVVMGGTNNVSDGEKPRTVVTKIHNMVQESRSANPATKIIVSGLLPRADSTLTHNINTINLVLKRTAADHGYTFMDNAKSISVDRELKRDGLHPNRRGIIQLCDNIAATVRDFHNGHQKIHRSQDRSYAQAVQGVSHIPVVQLTRCPEWTSVLNPWF